MQTLRQQVTQDTEVQKIIQACMQNPSGNKDYTVKDGLLYWKDKLVTHNQSTLIQDILREYYSSPIGGHAGVLNSSGLR